MTITMYKLYIKLIVIFLNKINLDKGDFATFIEFVAARRDFHFKNVLD